MSTNNRAQELRNTVSKMVQLLEGTEQVLLSTPAADEQAVIIESKIWAVNVVKEYLKGLIMQHTNGSIPASIFLFGSYNPGELKIYKTILGNCTLDMQRYYCRGECAECVYSNLCNNIRSAYEVVATYMDEKQKEVTSV